MYPERRVVVDEPAVVQGDAYATRGSGLTGYAVAKYAFILAIVVVILFFVAKYVLPMIGGGDG